MKSIIFIIIIMSMALISCNDAQVASNNISRAADQFEIYRRVVFYNGITGKYILSIEGYCSIDEYRGKLTVTVKTKNNVYLKHYLGLSDNVTYFAEQLKPANVRVDRYRVIFKPSAIIPTIDLQ